MTADDLTALFSDLPRISLIEHYTVIGSTNDRARELARDDAPGGRAPEIALIVADEQQAGRGRQNRSWYTPPGTALAFSLLTRPAIAARHAMRLTMLAGLAAVEGIEQATGLRLYLKWPNDVVTVTMNNTQGASSKEQSPFTRKIGGILTECALAGDRIDYAVVGIGLNVNVDFTQHAELREVATSLRRLAGREIDRWVVLKAVVAAFVDRYAWLGANSAPGADFAPSVDFAVGTPHHLRDAWAARLINLRRHIRVDLNGQILTGYAEGVDDDGALLLRTEATQLHRLLSGDVTLHDLNR
jgi:BirA family biotin operon repressor/biotin-[acetyl-CoA-carboxylase] ligase